MPLHIWSCANCSLRGGNASFVGSAIFITRPHATFAGEQTSQESRASRAMPGSEGADKQPQQKQDSTASAAPSRSGKAMAPAEASTGSAEPAAAAPGDRAQALNDPPAGRDSHLHSTSDEVSSGGLPSAPSSSERAQERASSEAAELAGGHHAEAQSAAQPAAGEREFGATVDGGQAKLPPRSLPPSRGGSAEALSAQGGGLPARPRGPPPFPEDPGSIRSQRQFAPVGDLGNALDKQVSTSSHIVYALWSAFFFFG